MGPRDFGVHATHTWRLGDLAAKHAMLRAGLGYGSLPAHMVAEDLATGRLVQIVPAEWDGRAHAPSLAICIAWRTDAAPGPAGQWLISRLVARDQTADEQEPTIP
jgi:DNA-binding transcriptional LysR family regulator